MTIIVIIGIMVIIILIYGYNVIRYNKYTIYILVGGIPTPLKHMNSSVGVIKFPTEWKNKIHVPNHQPDRNMSI